MFARLPDAAADRALVTIDIDGVAATARAGDTVAAALLAAGVAVCRATPVTGSLRAPFCMMGVCFDCLVTIDGQGSQQACLRVVADGMRIQTQRGARALDVVVEDPS